MRGRFGPFLRASRLDGIGESGSGQVDGDFAFIRPWGFDPATNRVPTQVWHGGDDLMLPRAHRRWLADTCPSAEPRLVHVMGHLQVPARHIAEVHGWIVDRF